MPRGHKRRADGEGTVYQLSDGTWKAELSIDGRTVTRRAKTRKEAAAKLAELRAMRDLGLQVGTGAQTLEAWQRYWLTTIAPLEGLKPATIERHTYVCAHYLWPELGAISLERLSAPDVERWGRSMVARELSQATIDNAMRRLRTALNLAVRRKMIRENVAAGVKIRVARKAVVDDDAPPTHLDAAQVKALLAHERDHRLAALFFLAVTLGPRQGELIGLRWSSVVLEGARPRIEIREQLQRLKGEPGRRRLHRETTKTEKSRTLLLAPEHVAALKAHRARQLAERLALRDAWRGEDLVFTSLAGTPLDASRLLRTFQAALRRAELPRVTFHSLRHTAGSLMLAAGAQIVDVAEVLGHSSPLVTAQIYAHSFERGQLAAVAGAVAMVA
jgi:integrase